MTNMLEDVWLFIVISLQLFCGFEVFFFPRNKTLKVSEAAVYERNYRGSPTPVFLPGKSHGQRSLVGCSPWGCEESDMTERLNFHFP